MRPAIFALALAVLLAGVACRGAVRLSPSGVPESVLGSGEWEANARRFEAEKVDVAAILTAADKVEPFRIRPLWEAQGGLDDYPVVSRAEALGPDFAARLAPLLLNPKSYVIPGGDAKLCIFEPRVAFRVWKGSSFADVLICFSCRQLMVVENDPAVPERHLGAKAARFRVGGDFDPVVAELSQLVREAFPGDPFLEEILKGRSGE